MPERHPIARVSEFPPGTRRIIEVKGSSIGVFNIDGEYYALRNSCPHQGAPLCLGIISGTTIPSKPYEYVYGWENQIIKCPWHGWEFDVASGRSVFNPHKVRIKTYDVEVELDEEEDPSIETFPVAVEEGVVILIA